MKKKIIIPLLSLSMILGFVSCGNNDSQSSISQNNESIIVNKAVVVDQVTRSYLQVGETYQLNAHVYGTENDSVNYISSSSSIASVSSNGLVTALKEGNVNIIVSASDDKTVRKIVKFTIVKDAVSLIPGLNDVISSINALDFESGVNFNGNINLNLGNIGVKIGKKIQDKTSINTTLTSKEISLPVNIDVRQDEKDTEEKVGSYVRASLPLGDVIDSLITSNKAFNTIGAIIPLKGTLASSISGLIDSDYNSYLTANDNSDFYSLDVYDFGEQTFYTSLNRDFGTEEEHSYLPYAFEDKQGFELIGKIAGFVYDALQGNDVDTSTIKSNLEINSLADLFSKDTLLKLQVMLNDYLESQENENGTKVKFNESFMTLINAEMSEKKIGGTTEFDLDNGIEVSIDLPKELTEISFNLVKENNQYSSMNLSLKGKKVDGTEYEALNISLDIPNETIGKDSINAEVEQTNNYLNASSSFVCGNTINMITKSTSVKEINKTANDLYEMVTDYSIDLSSNKQAIKDVTNFLDYYYDKHYSSAERQNLLYPMYNKLTKINAARDVVTVQYPYTKFYDNDFISVNHYVDFKPVDDFTSSFKSGKDTIIEVDENGVLKGHKYYSGTITSGNEKGFNNSTSVKVTITPNSESTLTKAQTSSCTLYYGGEAEFEKTATQLLEHENFDTETHTLTMHENEEFDLNQILSFPEGYSISTVSLNNTKKILDTSTTKKDNLVVKTLTKQLDDDGINYRSIASVQINVKYPNPEDITKTIQEKVIIFVSIVD